MNETEGDDLWWIVGGVALTLITAAWAWFVLR